MFELGSFQWWLVTLKKLIFLLRCSTICVEHGCLSTIQPAPCLTICFVLMCNNYRTDGSGVMKFSCGGCLKANSLCAQCTLVQYHNHIWWKNLICLNTLHKTILAFIRVRTELTSSSIVSFFVSWDDWVIFVWLFPQNDSIYTFYETKDQMSLKISRGEDNYKRWNKKINKELNFSHLMNVR